MRRIVSPESPRPSMDPRAGLLVCSLRTVGGMSNVAKQPLWSVEEVAEYLRVPAKTIYAWRYQGFGPPAFRLGKHLRFRPAEVEAWLMERRDVANRSRST